MKDVIKVTSTELYELNGELNTCLLNIKTGICNMVDRMTKIDSVFYSSHSQVIRSKNTELGGKFESVVNKLKAHVDNLSLIATEYESAESENTDEALQIH